MGSALAPQGAERSDVFCVSKIYRALNARGGGALLEWDLPWRRRRGAQRRILRQQNIQGIFNVCGMPVFCMGDDHMESILREGLKALRIDAPEGAVVCAGRSIIYAFRKMGEPGEKYAECALQAAQKAERHA